MKQGTKEWFEARKNRVTGSVAGAILGVDPNRSRDDVMRAMVREHHNAPEEVDEFLENAIFAYGKHHESGALLDFRMEAGVKVEPCGFFEYDNWLGASPDGLADNAIAVCEIKCPYGKRKDDPPIFKTALELPHYYAQMQIEMLCAKVDKCHFYQWAPHGSEYQIVYKDQPWLDKNVPLLFDFYNEYIAQRESTIHLEPRRKEVDTPYMLKLLAEYDELRESEENIKERKKDIFAEFVSATDNKNAIICGRSFTLVSKKGSISYAKLVKDHAADIDKEPYRGKPSKYWLLK